MTDTNILEADSKANPQTYQSYIKRLSKWVHWISTLFYDKLGNVDVNFEHRSRYRRMKGRWVQFNWITSGRFSCGNWGCWSWAPSITCSVQHLFGEHLVEKTPSRLSHLHFHRWGPYAAHAFADNIDWLKAPTENCKTLPTNWKNVEWKSALTRASRS